MAKMLDGMEALLRGEVPPPAAATLLGMRLATFSAGEALVELDATAAGHPAGRRPRRGRRCRDGLGYMNTRGRGRELPTVGMQTYVPPTGAQRPHAAPGDV